MRKPTLALLVGALCAASLTAQKGFPIAEGIEVTFKPPRGWIYLGNYGDRGTLRAMYAAVRSFSPKAGRAGAHRPTLRLMWLDEKVLKAQAEAKSDYPLRTIYKNARDYIDRSRDAKGEIKDISETKIGDQKATTYHVEYARKITREGKTTDIGALAHHLTSVKLDGGELLIEFELIAEQFKRQRGSFVKSLATFKFKPKDKAKAPAKRATPPWRVNVVEWHKKPKAERDKIRAEWGKNFLAEVAKENNPGWKSSKKGKNLLVLSRTDAKFTKRLTNACVEGLKWAEKWFGRISDDATMPVVLKIFDSQEEERTYRSRQLAVNPYNYEPNRRTIYTFKDASTGNLGDGMGGVLSAAVRAYIDDKHPLVLENMPRWVVAGIDGISAGSRFTKKGLLLFPSEDEMKRFAVLKQKNSDKLCVWWFTHEMPFGHATKLDGTEDVDFVTWYAYECARLMRWLDEGGDKELKNEDFLSKYLATVGKIAIDFPDRPEAYVDMQNIPDGKIKEFRKKMYKRRVDFLTKVNHTIMPFQNSFWGPVDKKWQDWNEEFRKRKFKKK